MQRHAAQRYKAFPLQETGVGGNRKVVVRRRRDEFQVLQRGEVAEGNPEVDVQQASYVEPGFTVRQDVKLFDARGVCENERNVVFDGGRYVKTYAQRVMTSGHGKEEFREARPRGVHRDGAPHVARRGDYRSPVLAYVGDEDRTGKTSLLQCSLSTDLEYASKYIIGYGRPGWSRDADRVSQWLWHVKESLDSGMSVSEVKETPTE